MRKGAELLSFCNSWRRSCNCWKLALGRGQRVKAHRPLLGKHTAMKWSSCEPQATGSGLPQKRPNVMKRKLLEDNMVWEDDIRAVPDSERLNFVRDEECCCFLSFKTSSKISRWESQVLCWLCLWYVKRWVKNHSRVKRKSSVSKEANWNSFYFS